MQTQAVSNNAFVLNLKTEYHLDIQKILSTNFILAVLLKRLVGGISNGQKNFKNFQI